MPFPSNSPTDFSASIARLRAGDEAALAEIYRELYTTLWRLALILNPVHAIAEEMIQEIFLALWRRRETLKETDDLRAYLYAALRNRARDLARRATVADATDQAFLDTRLDLPMATISSPDDDLAASVFREAYRRALSALSERERIALVLRHEEEMTLEQIAQVLGVSIVGARGVVLRAQQKLRALLAEFREPD